MKYLLLVALMLVNIAAVVSQAPCGDGWSLYMDGNKCIKVFEANESWSHSNDKCVQEDARLLSIPDNKTQDFVNVLIKDGPPPTDIFGIYWISLNDRENEGTYLWADGSNTSSYQHWGYSEPNHFFPDENCVAILNDPNHHWNDDRCFIEASFICEKRGPGCEYMNGGCSDNDACHDSNGGNWGVTCVADQ